MTDICITVTFNSYSAGLGRAAYIGKSHSGGREDVLLQYVVNNSLREHPVLARLKLVRNLLELESNPHIHPDLKYGKNLCNIDFGHRVAT